jgi:pimeloyl-ACP methyl ester carboxylesterase
MLTLLVLAGGIAYEVLGRVEDARRFPVRGRMVDIGGYRLNVDCTGSGTPTVILESGLGEHALSWLGVQRGVERFTRVCSYDRAGYGRSDPGPHPRSSRQIARELHALLTKIAEPGPYVLVGHSFGGYNVRVYAGLYRQEVSGVVLVDSSHEDQERFLPASVRAQADGLQKLAPFVPTLRFFGLLRLRDKLQPAAVPGSKLPADVMHQLSALALRPNYLPTVLREYRAFARESAAEVRASGSLGALPLMVLTAGQAENPGNRELDGFRKAWLQQLQPGLVRLSLKGRQLVVEDSDHRMPYEDPDAIVSAIQRVWAEARSLTDQ